MRRLPITFLSLSLCSACVGTPGTIGAVLKQKSDRHVVVDEAPQGLGAGLAGVREGDEILFIEGRDPRKMTPAEIHDALTGEIGDEVRLTLLRGDEVLHVRVTRTQAVPYRVRP